MVCSIPPYQVLLLMRGHQQGRHTQAAKFRDFLVLIIFLWTKTASTMKNSRNFDGLQHSSLPIAVAHEGTPTGGHTQAAKFRDFLVLIIFSWPEKASRMKNSRNFDGFQHSSLSCAVASEETPTGASHQSCKFS